MTKEEFTCGFCYRPHIGTNLPSTWDIVWQTPVCPKCQRRVAEDGGYGVVKLGAYAAERAADLLKDTKIEPTRQHLIVGDIVEGEVGEKYEVTQTAGGFSVLKLLDSDTETLDSCHKTPASIPQPPPAPGKTVVLDQVLKDIQERSDTGLRKYGVRLQTNNGRDALWDSYQEAIDLVMYLRQALLEREEK